MLSPDSLVNGLSVFRLHASQTLRKNSERHTLTSPKEVRVMIGYCAVLVKA